MKVTSLFSALSQRHTSHGITSSGSPKWACAAEHLWSNANWSQELVNDDRHQNGSFRCATAYKTCSGMMYGYFVGRQTLGCHHNLKNVQLAVSLCSCGLRRKISFMSLNAPNLWHFIASNETLLNIYDTNIHLTSYRTPSLRRSRSRSVQRPSQQSPTSTISFRADDRCREWSEIQFPFSYSDLLELEFRREFYANLLWSMFV